MHEDSKRPAIVRRRDDVVDYPKVVHLSSPHAFRNLMFTERRKPLGGEA